MGAAYFYHLTRRPLEATLPLLLEKSLAAGWRVELRGRESQRMEWLDQKLWLGAEEGFLPHGLAGGPHDDLQPVLLTVGTDGVGGRSCLMAVDGVEVAADEVNAMERVCILFDGHDGQALERARAQWRDLTGAGCSAQYWSEDSGRWEMKASAGE